MAETLTLEENYDEELNKIAQKRYGEDFRTLCNDKRAIVRRLYESGYPNLDGI